MTKIISVYFNGTNDRNDVPEKGRISLATLLAHITINDVNNYSFCVNGCGVESRDIRDLGVVFGFHLQKQVLKIAKEIKDIIDESEDDIVLNIYGFSRGGIAAFSLCKELKQIAPERLTINVATVDPVPVNFIVSVCGDMFFGTKSTLSAAVADLTTCNNIANMLALFANRPLPDIYGFAPLLPALPTTCHSEIDVTPGRHESAVSFYKEGNSVRALNNESVLVCNRVIEFMKQWGTVYDFERLQLDDILVCPSDSPQLLDLYEELARQTVNDEVRSMHFSKTIFTTPGKYLNRYHQRLCNVQEEDIRGEDCALTIQNRN
ncbi:hypothetical protein [Legionella fallonii]|nr:hypothetical protein [Legionella fallonii]